MSLLLDRRFQWNNASHQGMRSTCRVRAFSTEGLGPAIIVTDAKENQGPPVAQAIACLVCILEGLDDIRSLVGYTDFESAMWYLGDMTAIGPRFFRIRENQEEAGCYRVDAMDHISADSMDQILGADLSANLFETRRFS